MAADWQQFLRRWTAAGLLDEVVAERIRAFESQQAPTQGFRWSVLAALAFGGILLGSGVLLFVSAHWDQLSPAQRFSLVLFMVIVFHAGGAFTAWRFPALSITLHAVGTVALGAGIFLAGQIFNMAAHWPGGVMLWFIGAASAWWILDQWPQGLLAALLLPTWLAGEWSVATENLTGADDVVAVGLALLAVTYLASRAREDRRALMRGLEIIGCIAIVPCVTIVATRGGFSYYPPNHAPTSLLAIGWTAALALPVGVAIWLRRTESKMIFGAALWILLLDAIARASATHTDFANLGVYGWCGLGAVGMVAWGVVETRGSRINMGFAGFAVTVLIFYFDDVWDKMGRAESLIGLGVLFLYGGWLLERVRRKLLLKIQGAPA